MVVRKQWKCGGGGEGKIYIKMRRWSRRGENNKTVEEEENKKMRRESNKIVKECMIKLV